MAQLRLPKELFLLLPTEVWMIIGKILNEDFASRVFHLENILDFPHLEEEDARGYVYSGYTFKTDYYTWNIHEQEIEFFTPTTDIYWCRSDELDNAERWYVRLTCTCMPYGGYKYSNEFNENLDSCLHDDCELLKMNDSYTFLDLMSIF